MPLTGFDSRRRRYQQGPYSRPGRHINTGETQMVNAIPYSAPRLVDPRGGNGSLDAEWGLGLAALGVIAAFFGITVTVVVNIWHWCPATSSVQVCSNAVQRWFTTGCSRSLVE